MLFACVDELIRHVSLDEPAPDALATEAMGSFDPYPLEDLPEEKGRGLQPASAGDLLVTPLGPATLGLDGGSTGEH